VLLGVRGQPWRRHRRLGCGCALTAGAVGFVGVGDGDVPGDQGGEEPRLDVRVRQW
jgi:hypothetical protein